MICTVYNNIQHITEPKLYEVDVVLGWIRDCRIKDKIEKLRKTTDLELNRKLKSDLPSIVFAGTFTNRTDEHCEALSGLAILDFDHLADVEQTKKELAKKPYIYSAFVSPNGDGVKALARIPKQFARFAGYYRGLQKHHPELDPKNKNISRVCFLSSDPNIYINKDATEFTEYVEEPRSADRPIYHNEIKIEDTSIIIQNLFKWWSGKYQMTAGNRNHNIFVLASAFNEYGVSQHEALYFCYQYQQEDFAEKEIEQTVKSAYRKTNLHATKEFTAVEKLVNYSPKEIPTQPEAELSLPQQIFNSAFVDVSKKLDYPKPAISIGYHTTGGNNYPTSFGTYGNFSAIVGASKSRKTFFKSLLVSAYVGGQSDRYLGQIQGHRDSGQFVIDIDTEQGEWHAQNVFKRIPKMCGGNPDFYKPFALRPYSHLERIQFIDYLVYESQYKDNIGLMVIDGLADLVADFNDLKETNLLIQKVMKWTDDKKFHLMTIIHQNSYTNKATGHLGSSILKKAETVCNLAIVDNMAEVAFSYTRGFPIDKVYFNINEDGLPYVGDTPPPAQNLKKIIKEEETPF